MDGSVRALVQPEWPPLRHVHAGWNALSPDEQAQVEQRVLAVLSDFAFPPDVPRDALLRFFSFLAQVETIAIEIPMRFLPHAKPELQPALRRQLVDEVFHSTLFARLAHELSYPAAQPPPPLPSAERLLEEIRAQEDLAITATLLNLAAEGWIETLFRHARNWGIADPVFQAVLEDEARHVHEATDYAEDLDMDQARSALHALEQGLVEVGAEPTVSLPMLRLAGPERYRALLRDLHKSHVRHLAVVGLEPSQEWFEATAAAEAMAELGRADEEPVAVEDTAWRAFARRVWDHPRDPTMQGAFEVRVRHVPKPLLTPVFVAAVGRAWAQHPELNVVLAQGRIWSLPQVQVGVRVQVAPGELATVLIPEADKRSVRDIQRMLADGVARLQAVRRRVQAQQEEDSPGGHGAGSVGAPGTQEPLSSWEDGMADWLPPNAARYSVSVSNVGKFGLETGSGAFTAHLSPSTDLTIGRRARRPAWRGVGYLPTWTLPVGALQDHRVFDGDHAGRAMQAIMSHLDRRHVRDLLATPDTLPSDLPDPVYDDAWFESLPAHLQATPAMMLMKVSPDGGVAGGTALGAATLLALGAAGFALYWGTRPKQNPDADDAPAGEEQVEYHCPRCKRLYRLPEMPRKGTLCPACRK